MTSADWPEQLPFTRRAVEQSLSRATLAKAEGLLRLKVVSDVAWLGDKGLFTARVRGTAPQPYGVRIGFVAKAGGGEPKIAGHCTCPMSYNCKHVGATLLHILEQRKEGPAQAPAAAAQPSPRMAEKAAPHARAPSVEITPAIAQWLTQLDRAQSTGSEIYDEGVKHRLIYVLQAAPPVRSVGMPQIGIIPSVTMLKADGSFSAKVAKANLDVSPVNAPRYLRTVDHEVLRRLRHAGDLDRGSNTVRLSGPAGFDILRMAAQTGRLRLDEVNGPVLREGPQVESRLAWEISPQGDQYPVLLKPEAADEAVWLAKLAPPVLIDPAAGTFHPVGVAGIDSAALIETFLDAPPLDFRQARLVSSQLDQRPRAIPLPAPRLLTPPRALEAKLQPALRLFKASAKPGFHYWEASHLAAVELAMAQISFRYGPVDVTPGDARTEIVTTIDGVLHVLRRKRERETKVLERIRRQTPLRPLSERGFRPISGDHAQALACQTDDDWLDVMNRIVPELRAEGWLVDVSDTFPFQLLPHSGALFADIEEGSGIDWIELRLGTLVGDERLDLVPVIARLIGGGALASFDEMSADASLILRLDETRYLPIPIATIRPVLENLAALFGAGRYDPADGKLRLGRYDLADLSALEAAAGASLVWKGGEALRIMGRSLREFGRIPALPPPPALQATLRPYQARGVDWLQFLARSGFGGLLADDMGLGKTVQTLAHLLHEKAAGRLSRPALLVCPTSVVGNWEREAAHFAPSLRLLSLHGLDRAKNFERIGASDLVLSTYPLISRDHETLKAVDWSLIVFDEAQMIKNPEAVTTKLVASLGAGQKIALTGTPIENHLGELWSLFNVLAPGYLGDKTGFTRAYRTPIEKKGDTARLAELTRRIKPFMLRRTKAEVAADLPPKNEMPEIVTFEGPQRTLYESVRLAMHERVREAIATQGLKRSTIIILDALLKLRQVCCDPRLVKMAKAPAGKARSAKLDRLVEMLPTLIDAGRRILLFSQFTSMLALIEAELAKAEIPYVLLTGDTRDRRGPIDQFQKGKVPLFLISLKAGGSGLNLTAADTVIHYDPWWNPAVEAQATDRAHRIGQTKTVFVHKLIAENTVEEKIEILKTRKAALASGILDPSGGTALDLTEADIDALFG
ncbi:DEAD/DEAH box helicase [Labrys monachus]|uniref:Superfamily II DNA or RNA helicase n=1 Tax=Labrys monachus TaxID=217067 RepID=A0ABU0FD81_9HYPH|nr:DEAD/DEAH box helicase [Labrys monachus]MDQ0392558.1 superfamily II DNA or RNA helicase [Labrys monachus]